MILRACKDAMIESCDLSRYLTLCSIDQSRFCVFTVVLFCILTGTVESAKLRIVLRTPRYLPLVTVFMHRPLGVYEPTWVLPCLFSCVVKCDLILFQLNYLFYKIRLDFV